MEGLLTFLSPCQYLALEIPSTVQSLCHGHLLLFQHHSGWQAESEEAEPFGM